MKQITATQFVRPNGKQVETIVLLDDEIANYIIDNEIKVSLETLDENKIIAYFDYGLKDEEDEPIEMIIVGDNLNSIFIKAIKQLKQ